MRGGRNRPRERQREGERGSGRGVKEEGVGGRD